MPKLCGLTPDQQDDYFIQRQARRIKSTLVYYLDNTPVSCLAALMHVNPLVMQRRFRGNTKWDLYTFTRVCDTLDVSNDDVLRMLGRKP